MRKEASRNDKTHYTIILFQQKARLLEFVFPFVNSLEPHLFLSAIFYQKQREGIFSSIFFLNLF